MSTEQIQMDSELELGKLKFQAEALAEAKALGMVDDEGLPSGNESPASVSKTETVTAREYSEVEKEQMEMGWDPNKTGNTAVSAEEYKRVGQIIEAKRAASKKADSATKEVQELTTTVKQLVEHNRRLEKASYDKALRDLDDERDNKIALGDVDGVRQLNLKEQVLNKAKEALEVTAPQAQPVQEELTVKVSEYQKRNEAWLYGQEAEDKKMQAMVKSVISYLKEAEPNISEDNAIKAIEDEIKTKFPHRFENPNKEKAPAVLKTTSTKGHGNPSLLSELSSEEKMTFYSIQKVDPTFSIDEYVKQIEVIGRRS